MSDEDLRADLRCAASNDDGPSWLAAARSLARAGDGDAAVGALFRARRRGSSIGADLEALGPAALDLFDAGTEVGVRDFAGSISLVTFAGDGSAVFGVTERPAPAIVAWDLASGRRDTLVELADDPDGVPRALSSDPSGARVASASRKLMDVDVAGRTATRVSHIGGAEVVHAGDAFFLLGGRGRGRLLRACDARGTVFFEVPVSENAVAGLGPCGSLAFLADGRVHFHEPLAAEACAGVAVADLGGLARLA
jgi:hypothetical protein